MTPTIIPYPKFLTKPWRCMALQAVHRQAIHHLAIHCHCRCSHINIPLPSKTSVAITSPSSRPSPSHCTVHYRAVCSRVDHCRCHQAVHRHRGAPLPSCCRQAVHRFSIAVKPTIAKPSRHPLPSCPSPSHSSPSPLPSCFHQRAVAITMSIAATSPSVVHRRAIVSSIAERSIAKPFIAVTVKSSIAVGSFHRRCIVVTPSIAKPLHRSSPLSPCAVHCQAVHCQAIHHLAIHCHHHCAYIDIALLSRQPLLLRCSQTVYCQAIVPSIAEPSIAKPFIAVAVEPSIDVALP
jgi:hypothetical protein